jgi:hypothetical protein
MNRRDRVERMVEYSEPPELIVNWPALLKR